MAGYDTYSGIGVPMQQPYRGSSLASVQSIPEDQGYASSGAPAQAQDPSQQQQQQTMPGQGFVPNPRGPIYGGSFLGAQGPAELRDQNLNPFQMSQKLGGGSVRDQDLAALHQTYQNMQNPMYAQMAYSGINNADQFLPGYQSWLQGRKGEGDLGQYFQSQSINNGPISGVNYSFDPSFGLRGSIGNINFDVARMDPSKNSSNFINSIGHFLRNDQNQYTGPSPNQMRSYWGQIPQGGVRGFQSQGPAPWGGGLANSYYSPGGLQGFGRNLWM